MILSISWKNIWRNKIRSLVVIVAVTIGLYGAVFGVALMQGIVNQKANDAIKNEISHIQIHHPEFRNNFKAEFTIPNSNEMLSKIEDIPTVVAACGRIKTMAMAVNSYTSVGAMINAIDPEQEKKVTRIFENIVDSAGTYFESKNDNAILISTTLAKHLKIVQFKITDKTIEKFTSIKVPKEIITNLATIKYELFRKEKDYIAKLEELIGVENTEKYETSLINNAMTYKLRSKIIFKFQGANGEMKDEVFKVVGYYKTSNTTFDRINVFVKKDYFMKLSGYDNNSAHEIAVLLENDNKIEKLTEEIKAINPEMETINFFEIDPMMEMMVKWTQVYYYILIVIILFALGFGIVNTMLMVVLERVKELGMLMAIGMNKVKIFVMIMLESIFLSIIGGVVGMLLGALTTWHLGKNGWNIAQYAEGFEAMGYSSVLYPQLSFDFLIGTTLLVILTGIIAAIYPARKALKLNPADAIRSDA